MSASQQAVEQVKHAVDYASVAIVVGTLADWLPPLAALVTLIWTLIRIYETDTVQKLLGRVTPPGDPQ